MIYFYRKFVILKAQDAAALLKTYKEELNMFDTMMIARKIRQARIDQNMTQMNLADAMGVSYQAVSNWERGNSMPDISKLEELCSVLHITVNELLGVEDTSQAVKVMDAQEMTVEELKEAAPALLPAEVKARMKAEKKRRKLDLDAIIALAPFLDEATLDELLEDVAVDSPEDLAGLAPFLSAETLERAVEKYDVDDLDELLPVAPFLSKETLDRIVQRCDVDDLDDLLPIAPFLSKEALERMVEKIITEDPDALEDAAGIAVFLPKGTLARILKNLL